MSQGNVYCVTLFDLFQALEISTTLVEIIALHTTALMLLNSPICSMSYSACNILIL